MPSPNTAPVPPVMVTPQVVVVKSPFNKVGSKPVISVSQLTPASVILNVLVSSSQLVAVINSFETEPSTSVEVIVKFGYSPVITVIPSPAKVTT